MDIALPKALRDRLEEPAAEALSGLLGAVMIEVEGRVRDVFSERLEARIGLAESRMEARWLAMREQVSQCATKGDLAALEAKLTIRLNEVATGLNARMDGQEARTDGLEARLDALAVRMDRMEARMGALEARMDRLEARMDRLEARMDAFEARLGALESRIEVLIEAKLETRMQKAENRLVRWMFGFFVTQVGITLAGILTAAAILT